MPHHTSTTHPRMSRAARSAQFAPFAALNGHFDTIEETGRYTEEAPVLSSDEITKLNEKLKIVRLCCGSDTEWRFSCFIPDPFKAGGSYVDICGAVVKIDEYTRLLHLATKDVLDIDMIIDITGPALEAYGLS